MKFTLFGEGSTDAPPVRFPTDKVRALFAYLAYHADQPISRKQLTTLLWGNRPDKAANANFRTTLSRLKKSLDKAFGAKTPLVVTRKTAMVTGSAEIDVRVFDTLWAQCEETERERWAERGHVVQRLTQAVALYQGAFLANFGLPDSMAFDEWATPLREQYHRRMLIALETIAAFHIVQQDWAQAETFARQQLTLEVWHEPAYRQLLRIYAGLNQPAMVRMLFEQCQTVLAEELGAEPSERTRDLFAALLQDVALPTATRTTKPTVPHNLPTEFTPFIGRIHELAQLQKLVSARVYRLITLVGHGGAGKTRLSLALAQSQMAYFADGVFFVSLAGSDTLPTAIGNALGLSFTGSQSPRDQLCNFLRDRELLLILDNLEHLLHDDATVDLILDLFGAAPNVVFVITSRRRLFVRAETLFPVGGLSYPVSDELPAVSADWLLTNFEAPRLFVERVQRVDMAYQPEADVATIATICRLVDGYPLALELAATQSGMASCAAVLDALLASMGALKTEMRDMPTRQRSLRAVFDYSWRLLSKGERDVLARLSVFRGGFDGVAAVAVGASAEILQTLVGHSLLQKQGERYVLHEMIREFAAAQLADTHALQATHATHFLERLAQMETALEGREPHIAAQTLLPDSDNVQGAWLFAAQQQHADLLALATNALSNFLQVRGLHHLGKSLFMTAVENQPDTSPALSNLLSEAGRFHLRLGQYDAAEQLARQAQKCGDEDWAVGNAANILAESLWRKGENEEAIAQLKRVEGRVQSAETVRLLGSAYYNCGNVHLHMREMHNAQSAFANALAIWQQIEHRRFEAVTLNALGVVAASQKEYVTAMQYYHRAIDYQQMLNNQYELAQIGVNLSYVECKRGAINAANRCLDAPIAYYIKSGNHAKLGWAFNNRGWFHHLLNANEEALTYLNEALTLAVQCKDIYLEALALHNLAKVAATLDRLSEAIDYYNQVLFLSRQHAIHHDPQMLLQEKKMLTDRLAKQHHMANLASVNYQIPQPPVPMPAPLH